MRKECRTLCGLFVVIIAIGVTLPAFGQQPNKDSAVIQHTGTVNMSELVEKVGNIIGNIETLTKNQKSVIEDVGDLKVQIARIDERTSNILTIVIGGIVGLFVTIVGGLIFQNLSVKKQMNQYIQKPVPRLEELDQKEQEEQKEYEYEYEPEPNGVTS